MIALFDGARQPALHLPAGKRPILDFQHSDVGYELITRTDQHVMAVVIHVRPGGRCIADNWPNTPKG